jgi:hypothetical protein
MSMIIMIGRYPNNQITNYPTRASLGANGGSMKAIGNIEYTCLRVLLVE